MVSIAAGFYLVFGLNFHYKPATHPEIKTVKLDSLKTLFDKSSNRFAQNIFGLNSQPINIIMTTGHKEKICSVLKKAGWKDLNNNEKLNIPLFWHAKEPICSLSMKKGNTLYLLRIWNTDTLYKSRQVYVAGANAITGEHWGIVPVFIKDLDHARDFVMKDFQMKAYLKRNKSIQINEPFIKENLFGHSYFSDGRAEVLVLEE